jgi:hypothetical protein
MITRLVLLFLCLSPLVLTAQEDFKDFFTDEVLRFDYLLTGTNISARVTEIQQKKEPAWGGKTYIQVTEQSLGNYRFRIKDQATNEIIYQQGFSPLFQEWQTTAEAKRIEKSFYQVLRFPFPKKKVELEISCRNRKGQFETIYNAILDPANYFISREKPLNIDFEMIRSSGVPSANVDIAILAEGYQVGEMGKFVKDAGRLMDSLFACEPFASLKNKFNIYALKTPSQESGTDIPGRNIYVNTLYNSTFYTFDIARYLTTTDLKSVYDQAATVPYDYLIVLVNSPEYGGGGFYNYLSVCTSDHILAPQVFIHEFGHEFAGLGDEYYSSQVAYEDYYNLKVEPWEPNLTTLVDFKSKWNYMIDRSTPVPTPRTAEYAGKVGVFEGGGYVEKGVYSPMDDCRMKSNKPNNFCPVCQKAIQKTIIKVTE